MNVVEISNLKKSYHKSSFALKDLSLSITVGSIFGILGPNGAGKSTVLNILAGIVKRTSGDVTIFERKIERGDYKYKKEIGFVLEQSHYLEKLTVKEYLHFAGAMYKIDEEEIEKRADELIGFFNLKEKENIWIEKCSKGMKKKVSLAAALIHQPKLIILDEPFEGIDPASTRRIKNNLLLMAKQGVTIIMASHNLEMVEKFCDEVAIINQGRLVFQSKTEDIRTKIKNNISRDSYESLEQIFVDVISKGNSNKPKKLSWLK